MFESGRLEHMRAGIDGPQRALLLPEVLDDHGTTLRQQPSHEPITRGFARQVLHDRGVPCNRHRPPTGPAESGGEPSTPTVKLERFIDIVDPKGEVIPEHQHRQFLQRAFTHTCLRPLPNGIQQVMNIPPVFDRPYLQPST